MKMHPLLPILKILLIPALIRTTIQGLSTKSAGILILAILVQTMALVSCADLERENELDPKAVNYNGGVDASSSSSDRGGIKLPQLSSSGGGKGTLIDSRDSKEYNTVEIGKQVWMAENLNYDTTGSKCGNGSSLSDANTSTCDKYGRLYNWETAMKACPKGWHLPTNKEWDALYRYADGTSGNESPYKSETAGKYLKATSGWNKDGNGEDSFGFAALPGGYGNSDGNFRDAGN